MKANEEFNMSVFLIQRDINYLSSMILIDEEKLPNLIERLDELKTKADKPSMIPGFTRLKQELMASTISKIETEIELIQQTLPGRKQLLCDKKAKLDELLKKNQEKW